MFVQPNPAEKAFARDTGLVLLRSPDDLSSESDCASCSGPQVGPERTSNWISPERQRHCRVPNKDNTAKAAFIHNRTRYDQVALKTV